MEHQPNQKKRNQNQPIQNHANQKVFKFRSRQRGSTQKSYRKFQNSRKTFENPPLCPPKYSIVRSPTSIFEWNPQGQCMHSTQTNSFCLQCTREVHMLSSDHFSMFLVVCQGFSRFINVFRCFSSIFQGFLMI